MCKQIEGVNGAMYSQCRIPGIVVTEKGTLLAYYECCRTNSDWAEIDIKVIRSTDEGESWQTVTVIPGKGSTTNNPVMFIKGEEIHFLFLRNYKVLFHSVSTDDGQTFSVPEEKPVDFDFFYNVMAVGPGHGIVHNGSMIVPVWIAQNETDPQAHIPSVIGTLYSDDGKTWQLGEIIGKDVLDNPSECALAVTKDSTVLISIRNENDTNRRKKTVSDEQRKSRRAFAQSKDGICGWEDLHFNEAMIDPVCMGSMCYENGVVYHVNCASAFERENLTVKISEDGFVTFRELFVDTPAGYADIAVKDGTLYIFYERDCDNGGLYFKKISL